MESYPEFGPVDGATWLRWKKVELKKKIIVDTFRRLKSYNWSIWIFNLFNCSRIL